MSSSVLLARSDLGVLRRFGASQTATWTAPGIPEGEHDNARPLLERVRAAAAWVVSSAGRRRIDHLVADVDESVCYMLRTPSLARPVLAATARTHGQDWGELAPIAGLEPLADPQPTKRRTKAEAEDDDGVAAPVISQTDSLIRLWLDALDARGVKVSMVSSLWHAMAQALGTAGQGVGLLVLAEHERLVWALARGDELLCGGSATIGTPERAPTPESPAHDPIRTAVRRASLDWLTWFGQLGVAPESITIVGPSAGALAEALPDTLRTLTVHTQPEDDPAAWVCGRLSQRALPSRPSARAALVRLTNRPTRATRWRYAWGAAALVLLGLGLGSLGYRFAGATRQIEELARQTREQASARVGEVIPNLNPYANIVMEMETALGNLKKIPAFTPPQQPPKIVDEMLRLAEVLSKHEGTRLSRVSLASDRGSLTCTVPDRRAGELIGSELETGLMKWTVQRDANLTVINLNGEWPK